MADSAAFVIVGASKAGASAAFALREAGFGGRVILIGGEDELPYDRPPLSKEYLRGDIEKGKLQLFPPAWYSERNIELRLGVRATSVDIRARTVKLDKGQTVAYDKLLLATGCRVRRLPVPGADLARIYYLRNDKDSEGIAEELQPGRRAVVIGAGFIGLEVASSAKKKGVDVTVIEMAPAPLVHVLGQDIGAILARHYAKQGIHLRLNERVERFHGEGRVQRVVGSSEASIDCDFVVVGVGVQPETEFLAGSGIELNNGVVANEYCETSVPDVYVAGDVANYYHPLIEQYVRLEHWSNAQNQGVVAAHNMLGNKEVYADVPWFWSDQFDLNIQLVGIPRQWDNILFRGNVEAMTFTAFFLKEGRMLAALAVNRAGDIRPSREIIKAGGNVDSDQLTNESVTMRNLMPSRT